MKKISMIVAMDRNRLIGDKNKLPWVLPKDMAYFKKITSGATVIMGRNTYDSIGFPLPNRKNVVLSNNTELEINNVNVFNSLDKAIKFCERDEDVFIIGGSEIYKQAMDLTDKIYCTEIDEEFAGNIYFPKFKHLFTKKTFCEKHLKDEKNKHDFSFCIYEK